MDFDQQVMLLTAFGGVAVVLTVEAVRPLRPVSKSPLWRWLNNLVLTTLDYALMFGLTPWLSLLAVPLISGGVQGLLGRSQLPPWAAFLVLFISLQLTSYWLHRLMHTVPALWRIHAVHHCDTEVDATTAFRHHPLEVILSSLVTLPVVLLLLPDPMMLLAYNALYAAVAIVHHGNFTFGPRVDRVLRLLIVTPDYHRLHHAAERRYTDSNYATLLPLLDYLFKTAAYVPAEQQKTMPMGLERFREKKFVRLDQMLLIPFRSGFWPAAGPVSSARA